MYGEAPIDDAKRILKAFAANQLAWLLPRAYLRLTRQTGRGSGEESFSQVAEYFRRCFDEYFPPLGVDKNKITDYLAGKQVLEYGPGDVPGVGLLMAAYGAAKVYCVDRFPMVALSEKNIAILNDILARLDSPQHAQARPCFRTEGDPASGFNSQVLEYLVRPNGLSGLRNTVDIIFSRAVLEHVNDLEASFIDMYQALRPGGVAIHKVDLRSHGLHRRNPLDFLSWPAFLWSLMYSYKGVPNRWRVNRYREVIAATNFELQSLEPTEFAAPEDIRSIRPHLAPAFYNVSDEDLSWLDFWLVLRKPREEDE